MNKYISREELIEEIEEEIAMGDKFDEKDVLINKGLKIALKYIKRHPSADVQPVKHGRWIVHYDDLFPLESTIECSVCGERENMDMRNDNYCPNCGARMDGDAE